MYRSPKNKKRRKILAATQVLNNLDIEKAREVLILDSYDDEEVLTALHQLRYELPSIHPKLRYESRDYLQSNNIPRYKNAKWLEGDELPKYISQQPK